MGLPLGAPQESSKTLAARSHLPPNNAYGARSHLPPETTCRLPASMCMQERSPSSSRSPVRGRRRSRSRSGSRRRRACRSPNSADDDKSSPANDNVLGNARTRRGRSRSPAPSFAPTVDTSAPCGAVVVRCKMCLFKNTSENPYSDKALAKLMSCEYRPWAGDGDIFNPKVPYCEPCVSFWDAGHWADEFEDQQAYEKEKAKSKGLHSCWMQGLDVYIAAVNEGEKRFRYRSANEQKNEGRALLTYLEIFVSRGRKN